MNMVTGLGMVFTGCLVKLKELCEDLLGPSHKEPSEGDKKILGIKKRKLLTEILPIITKNPHLQRLYTEYHGALSADNNDIL